MAAAIVPFPRTPVLAPGMAAIAIGEFAAREILARTVSQGFDKDRFLAARAERTDSEQFVAFAPGRKQ